MNGGLLPRSLFTTISSCGVVLLVLLCSLVATPLRAEEAAIAQGFKTSETNITPGALVSLTQDKASPNTVELANSDRVSRMLGVVSQKALLELSEGGKEVQVITSGAAQVLVSDINGDIKTGDKITASPIDGVGMKATVDMQVLGTAQTNLSSVSTSSRTLTDKVGTNQTVKVGTITVQINVAYATVNEDRNFLPSFLQAFANSVAGRSVSPVRVVISVLVLALGFISIAVLLYASVRSSIISIGRNPLSEGAVNKSLVEVGVTSLGILLVMLVAIYLTLRI